MYRLSVRGKAYICTKSKSSGRTLESFEHFRTVILWKGRNYSRKVVGRSSSSSSSSSSTPERLLQKWQVPVSTTWKHLHTNKTFLTRQSSGNVINYLDGQDPNELDWDARDFEDRLFDYLCNSDGRLSVGKFKTMLSATGLRETDPRLKECMQNFSELKAEFGADYYDNLSIDKDTFKTCLSQNVVLVKKAFKNEFVIPEFHSFGKILETIYRESKTNVKGKVATYIPQLARYNPDFWAVSVCTIDGQRFSIGDVTTPFCLQSVSKPLTYALVLNEHGSSFVHQYVGHEPSGQGFNQIILDRNDKPHNPMINSGAILMCSLLRQNMNTADRFDYTMRRFKQLAGGEQITFNNAVYLSEKETADRNFALGYYMREKQCFPVGTNLTEVLNFYFQLCSIEVTSDSGSVIAATLANGGVCPITGEKILSSEAVRDTLTLMHSCGMYDYSGEFAFRVGLPAKSGVSGAVMLVVPNVMGICMWSPPLDLWGNSCRGIQFCKDFVETFNFHNYDNVKHTPTKLDPRKQKSEIKAMDVVNLLFSAYNGDVTAMRRYALLGLDMNQSDYDGRTALHLAAAEGHLSVTNFLLDKCNSNPFAKDRWGFQPIDDAKRFGHKEIEEILQFHMEKKRQQHDKSTNETLQ